MFLSILNSKNQVIMNAKIKHFSLHTSACEKYIDHIKYGTIEPIGDCNAVYNVYLNDVQIRNNESLLRFEEIYRLDHTDRFSSNKSQEDRSFYVFIEPQLRGEFSWNITEHGYKNE